MKRGLLFLMIFLLTIASVSALELSHEIVQGEALPGGQVSYILHLNNNDNQDLEITIKAVDLNWILDQEGEEFTLSPGQAKDVEVSFTPLPEERIKPGSYGINLQVNTQTTRLERILPAKVLAYNEVLKVDFSTPAQIDPRRGTILRLSINNEHKVVLDDMNLDLSSQHFHFTRTVTLGKEESTELEFPVTLDPETIRGDYLASAKVTLEKNILVDKSLPYIIQEYEDLKEVSLPQQGFLLGGETIIQTNEGNTPVTNTVSRQFSWLSYKFTSFDSMPTRITENDEGFLAEWDLTVDPQESVSVSYTINYRMLVLIIILIIAALVAYYTFRKRNAITIDKRVLAMHTETGSVRVVKIVINVRNRGNTLINNLRVVDRVPSAIKAPTQYGILKPMTVKAAPEGTTMVWDFHTIRPREEKVISYRLEGKIQVLGKLRLSPAVAKYVLFGRGVSAFSSGVSLSEKK